jgi:hypothetical protein
LIQSNQKSSQQRGFFAAQGLCPANQAEPGLQTIAPLRSLKSITSANICYALQPHRPPLFCPLSPEAYLLTGKEKEILIIL